MQTIVHTNDKKPNAKVRLVDLKFWDVQNYWVRADLIKI